MCVSVCVCVCVCTVNDLVTKYKLQKVGSAKRKCYSTGGQNLLEAVNSADEEGTLYVFD